MRSTARETERTARPADTQYWQSYIIANKLSYSIVTYLLLSFISFKYTFYSIIFPEYLLNYLID